MIMEKENRSREELLQSVKEDFDKYADVYKALAGDEEAIRKMEELRKAHDAEK